MEDDMNWKVKSPKKIGRFTIRQVPKKKLKSPKKIGRFTIRQVKSKSPKKIGKMKIRKVQKKSPLKIRHNHLKPLDYEIMEKLQKGIVYKKMMSANKKKDEVKQNQLSPYSESDEEENFPKRPSLLSRQISDPEFCVRKLDLHGFHFDIIDDIENFETKIIYLSDKIKENLLKLVEISKIESKNNSRMFEEKVIIKNEIKKYNSQMNDIVKVMDDLL
jgi:hypothetical protein